MSASHLTAAGPEQNKPAAPPATTSAATRFGPLHVGLREDLVITRQMIRSGARYVVHDPLSFTNHIFTVQEYRVICAFHAGRSLASTFAALKDDGVLTADEEGTFYDFVMGLHGMGLLHLPGMPAEQLYQRYEQRQKAGRFSLLRMLMFKRISLLDPDILLQRTLRWFGWLFTRRGVCLWLALMFGVAWQCLGRLGELIDQPTDLLALQNLPMLWCSLIVLKVIHEFGHAYACKRFGGAVPDMGISLIFLTPCAYVDANSSWTFPSRWHRIVVAMSGMYVESLVAGVFALIWAGTEPGFCHDLARNVVVMASVTTVLVNINPLMKYDGYFVFSDLLGLVNLQQRATQLISGLANHFILGLPRPQFAYSRSEAILYGLYAPMTLCYRIVLAFVMTALVMMTWPALGLVLGACFGWLLIVAPTLQLFGYLWLSKKTASVRLRARLVAVGSALAAMLMLALMPVSASVVGKGVLDPGMRLSVRAPDNGFVESVGVRSGHTVEPRSLVCRISNPILAERRSELAAEIKAQTVRLDTIETSDPTLAATIKARLEFLHARSEELETRTQQLEVTVPLAGTIVGRVSTLPGRFVHEGDELMEVQSQKSFVRVVLSEVEVVRARLEIGSEAELRWTCDPNKTVRGLVREIRASASRERVPVELTIAAGGEIFVRAVEKTTQADQPYLHVFIEVDQVPFANAGSGLTATVRIGAHIETLGDWLHRRLLTFVNQLRMT